MQDFYTPKQLSEKLGKSESGYRIRAAFGEFKHAVKMGNTWLIPLKDVNRWGRGYDTECAPAKPLSPETPGDPSDIVLAQNNDGRFGIYINEHWYGAAQALEIAAYLQEHRAWLEEKAAANEEKSHEGD